MNDTKSLKTMITAVVDYYEGEPIENIRAEHIIEQHEFHLWVEAYRSIALEFVELRLENEKMRKIVVDMLFEQKDKLKDQ